jgi:hypothetical protein
MELLRAGRGGCGHTAQEAHCVSPVPRLHCA